MPARLRLDVYLGEYFCIIIEQKGGMRIAMLQLWAATGDFLLRDYMDFLRRTQLDFFNNILDIFRLYVPARLRLDVYLDEYFCIIIGQKGGMRIAMLLLRVANGDFLLRDYTEILRRTQGNFFNNILDILRLNAPARLRQDGDLDEYFCTGLGIGRRGIKVERTGLQKPVLSPIN
ncbi:MAG: hypothetical protein LBH04_12545 [Tannerellaceae bacterium]|jgi:hypothetical protein|nr:hypothetical protein [Tannerellaceae bacterium]